MFLTLVQNPGSAVGAVDMKPEIEFLCDVRKLIKWIDGAGVDSPRAANDAERSQTFAMVRLDALPQQIDADALAIVTGNRAHLIASKAQNVCRFRNGHVDFFRSINRQRRTGIPKTAARRVCARPATTRD